MRGKQFRQQRTCDGWEEDGDESEEEVATRHYGNDAIDRRCTDG